MRRNLTTNKQEAIKKIENLKWLTILDKTINFEREMITKKEVFDIIKKLDEPEKPVVPQFVADWYEENKYDIENNIYKLCMDFYLEKLDEEIYDWFSDSEIKQDFAWAWEFAKEVEE